MYLCDMLSYYMSKKWYCWFMILRKFPFGKIRLYVIEMHRELKPQLWDFFISCEIYWELWYLNFCICWQERKSRGSGYTNLLKMPCKFVQNALQIVFNPVLMCFGSNSIYWSILFSQLLSVLAVGGCCNVHTEVLGWVMKTWMLRKIKFTVMI